MGRKITTAIAASLLALVLPAAASAHHLARHSAAHKARTHHHHHHKRAHTVVFSPVSTTGSSNTETKTETPSGETAGTIASYENGVLKITLNDGTTVSGMVTEGTDISCGCSGHDGWQNDGEGQGGDDGHDGWQNSGGDERANFQGDWEHGGSQGTSQETCGVSSLVAGAKVKRASLNFSATGAEWAFVELVPTTEGP